MSTSEIIALVASICAAISALSVVIGTALHYRQSKPKIWIDIKQRPGDCCYIYNPIGPVTVEHFAFMTVSFANLSSVGCNIVAVYIMYEGQRYNVENPQQEQSNFLPSLW